MKISQREMEDKLDDGIEEEIWELASKLTLEEKISMIHGDGIFRTKGVERLGIPPLRMSDGPMGVRQELPDASLVPVGYSDDYVTYFPSNSALAATWNPERAYECGKALGEEARGRGKDVILAPGINIKRDPLCGRNFEYMSEDPYLIGTLAAPFIRGVQESDVSACVKHFAANGQETDRFMVDTKADERTLREIYFPGFKAAVQEGGTFSVMNAYNKLNGTHCSENSWLLDQVLREEWGFDGVVISDWDSIHTTEGAAKASIDLEMGVRTDFDAYYFAKPLLNAVKEGKIDEKYIDRKVCDILRLMVRLKMIGPEAARRRKGAYNTKEHRDTTLDTARESIILLKNEGLILPLTEAGMRMEESRAGENTNKRLHGARKKRIAVIGRNAEYVHAPGGGSAEIKALYEISPLMGLKKELGGNVEILYAPGYFIPGDKDPNCMDWEHPCDERNYMGSRAIFEEFREDKEKERCIEKAKEIRTQILEKREQYMAEACELARNADVVIFVGGLNHDYDMEGRDRDDMKLPYGQDELIRELLQIKPDTIVVMLTGSAVEMPWRDQVKALVWCYYSGMETGTALAEILLGKVNPSAKLPETLPAKYSDTVTARNGEFGKKGKIELKEGILVGYRYYEKEGIKPAFPFGYGLSYTTFELREVTVEKAYSACETVNMGRISTEKHTGLSEQPEDRCLEKQNGGSVLKERKGCDAKSDIAEKRLIWSEGEPDNVCLCVSVYVKNTGGLAGAEVIFCYVSDQECRAARPDRELKAYRKVFLEAGEEKTVTMELPYSAFSFFDTQSGRFVTEAGRFVLHVGNDPGSRKEIEIVL